MTDFDFRRFFPKGWEDVLEMMDTGIFKPKKFEDLKIFGRGTLHRLALSLREIADQKETTRLRAIEIERQIVALQNLSRERLPILPNHRPPYWFSKGDIVWCNLSHLRQIGQNPANNWIVGEITEVFYKSSGFKTDFGGGTEIFFSLTDYFVMHEWEKVDLAARPDFIPIWSGGKMSPSDFAD